MTRRPSSHLPSHLHPLGWSAVALCVGVLAASRWSGGGSAALVLAVVLAVIAAVTGRARWGAVLGAWGMLGLGLGQIALYRTASDDVTQVVGGGPQLVQMTVRIVDGPRWSADRFGRNSATWTADAIAVGDRAATGRVRVRVGDGAQAMGLRAGERLTLLGHWSVPTPPSNPGQVDFAWIDRTRGIRGTLSVRGPAQVVSRSTGEAWVSSALGGWRAGAVSLLSRGFPASREEEARILRALLLGETDGRLAELHDLFQRLGVTHHLVVSGTHLAVVGGFVWVLLRAVMGLWWAAWLTPRRVLGVTLGVVAAYGLAVAPGEAVSRSVMLALLVGAGLMLGRQVNVLNLLGLCCLVLVVLDPLAVLRPGFQLTFGVVWALCVVTPPLSAAIRRFRDPDVAVADAWRLAGAESGRGGGWGRAGVGWGVRWRRLAWGPGVTLVSAAVAAWLASVPIVAFHFGQLSPWAAIASVLLSPVVFTAIVIAALKVVLTGLLPFLAGVWAIPAWMSAALLRESAEALAVLPAGDVGGTAIGAWAALLLAAVLGGAALWGTPKPPIVLPGAIPPPRDETRERRHAAVAWFAAAAVILMTPLAAKWRPQDHGGLRLTLLSVGAAQCAVLEHPDGSATVIDAGSSGSDVYRHVLEPFLRYRRITTLRRVVLSHGDADHTAGAALLVSRRRVGELVVGEQFVHAAEADLARGEDSPAAAALATARQRGVPVRVAAGGDSWRIEGLTLDVLHPEPGRWQGLTPNDASLVLRVQYAGRVILLGSDVEETGQGLLLASPALLRSDVLVAPHHGSHERTLLPLIEATHAEYVLVSDDPTPSGTQTRFFSQMTGRNERLLRTSQAGAITVTISPAGQLGVSTHLPVH